MRAARYVGVLAVVAMTAAVGCDRDDSRPSGTVDRVGSAAGNAGSGAVQGLQSAGRGIEYGARELGQTLSGTQGNPEAERRSQEARERMDQHAREAEQRFDRAGRQINAPDPEVREPSTRRGGGPVER